MSSPSLPMSSALSQDDDYDETEKNISNTQAKVNVDEDFNSNDFNSNDLLY